MHFMINGVTMKILADDYILRALQEDVTSEDVTTNAVMPMPKQGKAQLICKETGISYETIIYNTNYMIPIDIMEYFYRIEYKNYGVIQYQPIGNEYLLLGTNFDEEETRYYAVLLLDSKHEILEKKHHSQLESAIYDFNNRFYDLKIKEHKECEDHIKHCIEEHINFLKERNEEVQ